MKLAILSPIILAAGIWSAGASVGSAITRFHDFNRYVEVKGLDEEVVKADQATWILEFASSSNDLKQLYNNVALAQNVVSKFLVDQGFQTNEMQKRQVLVTDNESLPYGTPRTPNSPRYTASAGFSITTPHVDFVSEAVQKTGQLVQSEILIRSSNVRYAYTSLNTIKVDMLNKATENARNAALSFAKNSKSRLGTIRMANQGQFSITATDGDDAYDSSGILKKVRVVTTVQYFIQ